ncbi:far upstream element-binding protein [Fistulifera solaris]|uniref:Far upstream element-binding protein n=1 Tax=Fistulifera solaris TaxID=1519565 RepID=A0A1Z5K9T4_FISSO|nr:far upstream element-binding protein [Fistulifera solaris]|eukprot:GAX22922.1 far upstream element-binding protein [Fistulifera solaris]
MSDPKVSAEEALERAKMIAARLTGADTSTAVSSSEGSSSSRKRSRWGLTAEEPQAPLEMARLVAAKLSSTVQNKPNEATADETIIQKRIWIKTTRERPPKHFRLFLEDKLHYPGVTVELQGRGASDKPPLPGVPEQPLHIVISGSDKTLIDQVDLSLDVLLQQAEQEPPLVPPEDPDAIVDQSRALAVVGTAASSSYRPASVAQLIGQANLPTDGGDWIDEDVLVPNGVVGFIIGRGGENIASMQARTGAKVQIQKEHELQPGQTQRTITLSAPTQQAIDECREIIMKMVREKASAFGVSLSKDERLLKEALDAGHALVTVQVPDADVGLIIGKGGATIKAIQEQTGANIQVPPSADVNDATKRTISITHADKAGALAAKERIESLLKNMPSYGSGEEQITIQIQIPDKDVGLCIGRQGCVIREMQGKSGSRIQIPSYPTPGETFRIATVSGSKKGCETVQQMIASIIEAQSSAPVMSGTFQSYGRQGEEQYSAEWLAYHAAQLAAQEQYTQGHQQQHYPSQQQQVVAAPTPQHPAPDAYYEEFFRYSYYYGEDAARQHYGAWSPPVGTPNPYGVNPNIVQAPAAVSAPSPSPAPVSVQQATPEARETSQRRVSNLPAWMTK